MKRRKREKLPHDVIEEILERLEAKSLVRLRCVSKQWNSTIISTNFVSRHLIRAQSRDPHVLFRAAESLSYLCSWQIKSPEFQRFNIFPKSNRNFFITGSCDGLVCVYAFIRSLHVFNPATRWIRSLPCANIQKINHLMQTEYRGDYCRPNHLGFGKDIITGKYKMVWLYNSFFEQDLKETTCEVFDFDTNTWRCVMSSIHSIRDRDLPLYLDGSLYWLTLYEELKLIRFDLHTEVFHEMDQVLPMVDETSKTVLCCLNNRLCITGKKSNNKNQEIWSLNSDKVWEKTYTITNTSIHRSLLNPNIRCSLESPLITPITVFNKTEMLLLFEYTNSPFFVIQDTRTGSCTFNHVSVLVQACSYIPSLICV